MLKRLDLLQYFPEQFRRSCEEISCQATKHPVEVDTNTQRVVIVTRSTQDHLLEDNQYFLIVGKKDFNLNKIGKLVDNLIDRNQDIDELHNDLAALKAYV